MNKKKANANEDIRKRFTKEICRKAEECSVAKGGSGECLDQKDQALNHLRAKTREKKHTVARAEQRRSDTEEKA